MSIKLMSAAFQSDLPTETKFVLIAMCDWANDMGECSATVPYLSKLTGLPSHGVRRAVAELIKIGWLSGKPLNLRVTPPRQGAQ